MALALPPLFSGMARPRNFPPDLLDSPVRGDDEDAPLSPDPLEGYEPMGLRHMPHTDKYCTVSECETPTRQGRIRCDFHEKRHQRGQLLTAPRAERLGPKARLLEAAHRFADSDAEDDAEYQRNERALLRAARQIAPDALGALVRQGMSEARQRGVRLGRPRSMTHTEATALVETHGSLKAAVRALGVGRNTLRRALRQGPKAHIADPLRQAA